MAVLLIYNHESDPNVPLAERIHTAVLPSRKVLAKEGESDLAKYLANYETRWKEDPELRESVARRSKDPNDKNFPLSAFYWMILDKFDSQSGSSEIYSDEEAKKLLREGGWFNAGR